LLIAKVQEEKRGERERGVIAKFEMVVDERDRQHR
jgi:hypothetical protein